MTSNRGRDVAIKLLTVSFFLLVIQQLKSLTSIDINYALPVTEWGFGSPATGGSETAAWDPRVNPLGIPQGKAQNLPSPRLEGTADNVKRGGYGGKGDAAHLGGFGEIDPGGIAVGLFKHMIEVWGVHSVVDIGCGRGFSTSWFAMHGCDVICAEGSHDAIERSVLPDPASQVVEHDFSRGPWWPEKTYDAAWSVEFLEHVGAQYHYNYVAAFRKAALIFVTASSGEGWHHVEVHKRDWWIRKYESYGFRYDAEMSEQAKQIARETKKTYTGPGNVYLDGFYVRVTLMVFVNPVVASLPEHAHLFPELGCLAKPLKGGLKRKCSKQHGEMEPDQGMYPLNITNEMHEAWVRWLEPQVEVPKSATVKQD